MPFVNELLDEHFWLKVWSVLLVCISACFTLCNAGIVAVSFFVLLRHRWTFFNLFCWFAYSRNTGVPRLISTSVIVVYCCAPCVYAHRKEGHCFTCEPLWQIPIFNNSSRRESHLVCPTNGQWLAVGIRHTVTYYITYCTYLYVLLLFNALIRRQSLCWRFSEVQISGGRIGPSRS